MIVDSSVVLSILFAEPHATWAAEPLNQHGGALRMPSDHRRRFPCGRCTRDPALNRRASRTRQGSQRSAGG